MIALYTLAVVGVLALARLAVRATAALMERTVLADEPEPAPADHEAAIAYARRIEAGLAALGDDGRIKMSAVDGAHIAGYVLGLRQAGSGDADRAVADIPDGLLTPTLDAALRLKEGAPNAPDAAQVVDAVAREAERRYEERIRPLKDVRLDEDCEAVVDAFWTRGLEGVRDIATRLPTPRLRAVARQSTAENRTAPTRSTRLAMARTTEALLAEIVARDHARATTW